MAKNYLIAFLLFVEIFAYAQEFQGPPPPGCNDFAVIDTNNDGSEPFDINWLNNVYVPGWVQHHSEYDISGYVFEWRDLLTNEPVQGSAYIGYHGQHIMSTVTYVGLGPNYDDDPNFFYAVPSCMILYMYPASGDNDEDGIPNSEEDTNGNNNLTDDDPDGDWLGNYLDADNLGVSNLELRGFDMFPNPASEILFISLETEQKFDLYIYDPTGQLTLEIKNAKTQTIDISHFEKGIYLVKCIANDKQSVQKLVIL